MREPDWDDIRCFVGVARSGSLTDASKVLRLSITTLARRIDRLETALGMKVLRRGPAGSRLTEEGAVLFKQLQPGVQHMSQITRFAQALRSGTAEPAVRISSTESMVADVLAPRTDTLFKSHPDLRIELEVASELSNLNTGETDIAIRLADPRSPTLVARRLAPIRLGLFCSTAYLSGRDPADLDLESERVLWLDDRYGAIPENNWLTERGLGAALALRSSSVRSLQNAALSGAGIALCPAFSALRLGLVEVAYPALPVRQPWLVFHRDTRNNLRMSRVRDWIVECCREAFLNK